jgi:hypothetical protein
MGQIAKRVEDKRLLKLIRAFLNAGVIYAGPFEGDQRRFEIGKRRWVQHER